MLRNVLYFLFSFIFSLSAFGAPVFTPPEEAGSLIVYNRILAKVNEKSISVMDVKKKMDVFFTHTYPDLKNSKVARYQFYMSHWRETLSQMIDTELILADAEKLDLKVSEGEIRETLLERFGPSLAASLDALDMTYDEAHQMIRSELIVQRMNWYRVHAKALQVVNPQDIKTAYKEYCAQHPPFEEWKYQVFSIRSKEEKLSKELGEKAYALLMQNKIGLKALKEALEQELPPENEINIQVSEEVAAKKENLSATHKEALEKIECGCYSPPISQISKIGNNPAVCRIFYLKEQTKTNPLSFKEMASKLEEMLVQQAVAKEAASYTAKLREKFNFNEANVQETIPPDFQPFGLK